MGVYSYGLKGVISGAKALKNIFKPQKVSPDIKFIAPKFPKNKIQAAVRDVQKTAYAARGQMKKRSQEFDRDIQKVRSSLGQSMQKLVGEPVTKSGVSKGKDMKKFKTPSLNPKPINKATGGRVGLKRGTGLMKKKSNIQKIKETFAPKVSKNLCSLYTINRRHDKDPQICEP